MKIIKPTLITIAIAATIGLVGCQTTSAPIANTAQATQYQPLPVRQDIFQYWLDNGMQVILQPRKIPGVEMRLLVHSGSLQETDQQRGLAHFVEHMAFKGTTNFPNSQSFKTLEAQGINLGSHVNAVTSYNSTTYKLSLPHSNPKTTHLGLNILSDWASEISFNPEDFNREREVIVEEWRLRQGVGARINEQLESLRYEGSRLAERNAIGTIDVIRNAPVEEAVAYYKKWYQPQRMTLVISGMFDNFEVRRSIETLFANKAKGDTPADPLQWQQFTSHSELKTATVFDPENSRRFMQLLLQRDIDVPLNTVEGQWQETLDTLWLSVLNQRLAILVANGKLKSAQAIKQSHLLSKTRLQYLIVAHPFNDQYQAAFEQVSTELQRLAKQPISAEELATAKEQTHSKIEQQAKYHTRYGNQYLADQLVQADSYDLPMMDKPQQLALTEAFLASLTAQDIQQAVAARLNVASPKLALVGPDSDAKSVDIDQFITKWQEIRQSAPPAFTMTEPKISIDIKPAAKGNIISSASIDSSNDQEINEYQLSNGMKVVVMSQEGLKGGTQINLRLKGGRSLEPDNELGVVDWAGKLAQQCGYGDLTAHQVNQWSKQHQVFASPYSELLHHGFTASAETDQFDQALSLLYFKLTQANACQDKLAEMKKATLQGLTKVPAERIFMDQINQSAFEHSERLIADKNGPWQQFTVEKLTHWRERLYSDPSQMITTIVTNSDSKKLLPSIEKWLGGIEPNVQPQLKAVDRGVRPIAKQETKRFDIGSSNKAMVQIQYSNSHDWSLEDQSALQLLEQITNMRLRETVRVKASGVYVINMSQMLARDPAPYYLARLNFTTAPQRAEGLVKLANAVVQHVRTNGVTQQELNQAKKAWLVNQEQQEVYSDYWSASLSQDSFSEQPYKNTLEAKAYIEDVELSHVNQLATSLLGQNQKTYLLMPKQ